MKLEKLNEKIKKYFDDNIYDVIAAGNVGDGFVFTTDRYTMYVVRGEEVLSDKGAESARAGLLKTYNDIYTGGYVRGKAIPGKIDNRKIIKVCSTPDGSGGAYIQAKFTKLLPKNTLYYTIPEREIESPVVAGIWENDMINPVAVIMPVMVRDPKRFKKIDAVNV